MWNKIKTQLARFKNWIIFGVLGTGIAFAGVVGGQVNSITQEHLLKTPAHKIVASVNLSDGVKKYAYFTDIVPEKEEGVRIERNIHGWEKLEGEGLGEYIKDGNKYIRKNFTVFSGGAQFIEVSVGLGKTWRQVEYATTTQEAFDLQVSVYKQRFIARVYNVIDFFPVAHAADCTDADPCFPAAGANSPVDGQIENQRAATWSDVRDDASGTGAEDTTTNLPIVRSDKSGSPGTVTVLHALFLFDVVSIVGTLEDVTFTLHRGSSAAIDGSGGDVDVVSGENIASDSAVALGDFNAYAVLNAGASDIFASRSLANWGAAENAANPMDFDSDGVTFVQSAVDGDNIVRLMTRHSTDSDNVEPANSTFNIAYAKTADEPGTTNDPRLTATTSVAVLAIQFVPEIIWFEN